MATETQEVLAGMFTENTGRHMLDSGGANGRNWQRNKDKTVEDFLSSPYQTVRFDQYGIEVTLDLFHWLDERLEYDKEMDELFHETFIEETDPDGDKYWRENLAEFPEWLQRRGYDIPADAEFQGHTENSYNSECALSQTIQFQILMVEEAPNNEPGDVYVALEIHGGADVRGGYTNPRFFRVLDEFYSMFDFATVSLGTNEALVNPNQLTLDGSVPLYRLYWYSDDAGYRWYSDDWYKSISDMEYISLDDRSDDDIDLEVLYYDDDGKGFVKYQDRLIGLE